ncbi:DUF4435 domain-containing protein [Rhodopseudomonas palustris]|nr:DUF4435 domain-containing protein [Rhodopseudomonas palustris]
MISIARELDGFDIAQEIRQERQIHKGSFLLLEGDGDIKRFGKFVDEDHCSIQNCFGRKNLLQAIDLLYEEGFPGVLGLADADFDRLNSCVAVHEGVIYSEGHDFDLDVARSDVLRRYLLEVADQERCDAAGGIDGICNDLLERCKPLSVLRYVNHTQSLGYRLSQVRHREFIKDGVVDLDELITNVSSGKLAKNAPTLRSLVDSHVRMQYDLYQLTNGHDFLAFLGVDLQGRLGDRKPPQAWGSEVEIHFRLAFSEGDFVKRPLFRAVLAWEQDNPPYQILKMSLSYHHSVSTQ